MSRTYKDQPWKFRFPEEDFYFGCYKLPGTYCWMEYPGIKTKKRKKVDTKWHWMTTPMWWIREMMNQPQRAKGKMWEHEIVKWRLDELEEADPPSVSRKPHWYYW